MNPQAHFTANTALIFRIVLFFAFLGHGLISLNLAPSYVLHHNILGAINISPFSTNSLLAIFGVWDLLLALLVLFNIAPRFTYPAAITYLVLVGMAGWNFYLSRSGSWFGFAETARRLLWIFSALFLFYHYVKNKDHFTWLRMGISCAFLAHGFASMGFMGLNGGHIELASQVLSEELATKFVYYSGFSDTALGILLLTGIISRPVAIIGSFWIVFVVFISFLASIPEGIFRLGFLLSCIYVAMDTRCHKSTILSFFRKSPAAGDGF
jgi:hypothetical protein